MQNNQEQNKQVRTKNHIVSLRVMLPLFIMAMFIVGCEKEVTIEIPVSENKIVVEGYIENGLPPIVFLSKTIPFFGTINPNDLAQYQVNNAEVIVSNNGVYDTLQQFCLSTLPPIIREQVMQQFGIDSIQGNYDICAYTSVTNQIIGAFNNSYQLQVKAEGKTLTASTTIPNLVPIDTMFVKTNVSPNDSLVRLYFGFYDNANSRDFYRYFTKRNSEPFYAGKFQSAFDDGVINGLYFKAQIDRGEPRNTEFKPDYYGYFFKGDTITLKWCAIDENFYNFRHTLENDQPGPFSSYVRVKGNINGGLGIWGGYAASYKTIIVPN